MNDFDKIFNDLEIIDRYNKTAIYEDLTKGYGYHDLNHVKNVVKLTEKILKDLNYDSEFIIEAKIAAFLHDIGCVDGKENHQEKGFKYARKYLKRKAIVLKHEDLVLDAIRTHSDGFDTENIIALVLILSDKLDIKYTRVAKEGYNISGMRELQYIKDIIVDIENANMKIKFICDEKINKKELEEYYFITKVFKAIAAFCKKTKLSYEVFLSEDVWNFKF